MLGEIEFGVESKDDSSKCGTLAVAALTPGILKHDKTIDINHLHVSIARAHASVLKETARQQEFV